MGHVRVERDMYMYASLAGLVHEQLLRIVGFGLEDIGQINRTVVRFPRRRSATASPFSLPQDSQTAYVGQTDKLCATVVAPFLEPLGRLHSVVCPRQVLGVRIALLAGRMLEVPFPQADKRTLILSEIDGCFTDGLMVVSNCSLGHGSIRLVDLGKIAATILDTQNEQAVRVWPRPEIRIRASMYADGDTRRWHAQRLGYARMPDAELLYVKRVPIPANAAPLLRRCETRSMCERCREEVFNGREVTIDGLDLCRACAAQSGPMDDAAG